MPRAIIKDSDKFKKLIGGKIHKHLQDRKKDGSIIRIKTKNGKAIVTLPEVDVPEYNFGDNPLGIGAGPGRKGDKIGQVPGTGGDDDDGDKAGDHHKTGIEIQIGMDYLYEFMEKELGLPRLKPKDTQTFDEIRYKYNSIARTGLRPLIHKRKTLMETIKRTMCEGGDIDNMAIINDDFRYRTWNEEKIPNSNALIYMVRDCSGSMDSEKCEIVSIICGWIEAWISRFYKETQTIHIVHDTIAEEVSRNQFYSLQQMGGTMCSSGIKKITELSEDRFPPHKYNVYAFYFGDGENWSGDNQVFVRHLKEKLLPIVNLFGMVEIFNAWSESLAKSVAEDAEDEVEKDLIRIATIGEETDSNSFQRSKNLSDEEKNKQILNAIKIILGANRESEESIGSGVKSAA